MAGKSWAGQQGASQVRCKIDIVGAGIGGLVAAIALRKAGHEVHVFDCKGPADDVGGTVHLCPNANSVLCQLGVDVEKGVGSPLACARYHDARGELLCSIDIKAESRRWQKPWMTASRVEFLEHLKNTAVSKVPPGTPVQLHASTHVTAVDADSGTVRFADGTSSQADAVVSADDAYSIARSSISDGYQRACESDNEPQMNAFRFKIPLQTIKSGPQTGNLNDNLTSMNVFAHGDRKVVVNNSTGGLSVDFLCCHPAYGSEDVDGHSEKATRISRLLAAFQGFEPWILDAMSKTNEKDLDVQPSFDTKTLPKYADKHLAFSGNAAHPFAPHNTQGTAMAIEDGASLGVMLSGLNSKEEIPERLQLYSQIRYERVARVQEMTRVSPKSVASDISEAIHYGFNHDEVHHSTQVLRRHRWTKTSGVIWRQPISFGPMESPRQALTGPDSIYPRPDRLAEAESFTASIRFRTSATLLQNMFPSDAYAFAKPDSVAEASFVFQGIKNLSWLGGGGYNLVLFQIHGIRHSSAIDGKVRGGSYTPLVLEDLTDPIISGREDLGWPKLYSEIEVENGVGSGGGLSVNLSWRGARWASFSWESLKRCEPTGGHDKSAESKSGEAPAKPPEDAFVHKYIPATTGNLPNRQTADADYSVVMPPPSPTVAAVQWHHVAADASLQFTPGLGMRLPTLCHIADRLAELPLFEVVEAKLGTKQGQDDFAGAKRV